MDKEKLSIICGLPVCLTTIPADDLEGWHDASGEGKRLPLIIHNKWFIANNILLFSCFIGLLMDAEYNSVSNLAYSLPYFFLPDMPPAPELRYLYEHQTAKSAPHS